MKKLKQITALIGVIVLLGLYISTVVLACIGSDTAMQLLKAAIYATIVLPVLLWAYSLIFRLLKKNYSPEARREMENLKQKAGGSTETPRTDSTEKEDDE